MKSATFIGFRFWYCTTSTSPASAFLGRSIDEWRRRYTFENAIKVVDLGIRLGDIRGLQTEDVFDKGDEDTRRANLEKNSAKPAEIEFLLRRRVELNAMTSRQFVAFVERKLTANGVRKIVPTNADLIASYQVFARESTGREDCQP